MLEIVVVYMKCQQNRCSSAVCAAFCLEPNIRQKMSTFAILVVAVLGTPLWLAPGLVKLLPAVAYHFCLNLPEAFTKPRMSHKGVPSTGPKKMVCKM